MYTCNSYKKIFFYYLIDNYNIFCINSLPYYSIHSCKEGILICIQLGSMNIFDIKCQYNIICYNLKITCLYICIILRKYNFYSVLRYIMR